MSRVGKINSHKANEKGVFETIFHSRLLYVRVLVKVHELNLGFA
jgi:hypothetical protein